MANKSPAQADPQGHAKLIRIRPYRPSDSDQVRELFKVATIQEPTSLVQVAYNTQFKRPTAYVSYCAVLLGLVLVTFQTIPWIRYLGVALCIAGGALFGVLRYIFSYMAVKSLRQALDGDLKDIGKIFGMEPIVSDNSGRPENVEYVPIGKSGFWVAEAYEKGSETGDSGTKIIGSVGLNANKTSDETSAELRRMMVSTDYRRRGIALSLIQTALHHAQNQGVKSVVLSTTMFQPAAIAMYEKIGWVLQKKVSFNVLLDRMWVFYYSLDLNTVTVKV